MVVAVEGIDAAMVKVRETGSEMSGEPHDIPGVGRYVPFVDTEGNRNGMLQPVAVGKY